MSTAAGILLGVWVLLMALVSFGVAIPAILLGSIGILAAVFLFVAGWPYGVRQ